MVVPLASIQCAPTVSVDDIGTGNVSKGYVRLPVAER
jgi:hypothetical protein